MLHLVSLHMIRILLRRSMAWMLPFWVFGQCDFTGILFCNLYFLTAARTDGTLQAINSSLSIYGLVLCSALISY